jgi:hypothetical protein
MFDDEDLDRIGVALRVAEAIELCHGAYFIAETRNDSARTEANDANGIGFVLDLPIGRVSKFVSQLGREFEVGSEKLLRNALLLSQTRRILFVPTALEVDLYAIGRSPYEEAEFSRRRRVPARASGETLFVRSAEDSVLRQLLKFVDQGLVSEREWRDIVQVLCIRGASLDFQYLEQWALTLGVKEMLQQAQCEGAATHTAR